MKAATAKIAMAIGGAILLAGCAGIHNHRGEVLDSQLISSIQPGTDNKASVQKLLGTPSFVSEFTPNDWYYVSRDTLDIAFRNPKVQRQTVLHVKFDQAGNVAAVDHSGKELVENVKPVKQQTPTGGKKRTFFEDVFGGISTLGSGGGGQGGGDQGGGGGDQGQ
jgi:outer membrane protein assembly factor BamE (lipoprotein component of BamABCDE complex)